MSDEKPLQFSISNQIAHLVLDRPDKRNAMNRAFWQQFPALVEELDAQASARVLVISANGPAFCAGMDLSLFASSDSEEKLEIGRQREQLRRLVLDLQQCFSLLEQIRIPVLAAVQGACVGGGLDMISAADCRYCSEDAYFSIAEIKLGMTADLGTLQRLPHLLPQGLVRELAYTGRNLNAQEAYQLGLVNQVFASKEEMDNGVQQIAEQIAAQSPLAVQGCKEMINYSRDHSLADSLNYMAAWQSGMFQAPDMMVAMSAKGQGIKPDYDDLPAKKSWFE